MKKEFKLKFKFKGKRDYVQGPDIFDAVLSTLMPIFPEIKNIKYSAHSWLKNEAYLILCDKFDKEIQYNSLVTFYANDIPYFAYVINSGEQIIDRVEYSEETVNTKSIINGNSIEFQNILDYSFSEIIVSMNKYFMQSAITKEGKWIVTKIEYHDNTMLKDSKGRKIKIVLNNNFKNKLTKSRIYIDEMEVGLVYFSLI